MGEYIADLIVDDKVILELKAKNEIVEAHEVQLLHYLRATTIEVGLLINFGTAATFRRKMYANTRKKLPR